MSNNTSNKHLDKIIEEEINRQLFNSINSLKEQNNEDKKEIQKRQEDLRLASMSTDPDILKSLASSNDEEIREEVASNSHTPNDVLKQLSQDSDPDVRIAVLINPDIESSPDIVEELQYDESKRVRTKAEEVLDELTAEYEDRP